MRCDKLFASLTMQPCVRQEIWLDNGFSNAQIDAFCVNGKQINRFAISSMAAFVHRIRELDRSAHFSSFVQINWNWMRAIVVNHFLGTKHTFPLSFNFENMCELKLVNPIYDRNRCQIGPQAECSIYLLAEEITSASSSRTFTQLNCLIYIIAKLSFHDRRKIEIETQRRRFFTFAKSSSSSSSPPFADIYYVWFSENLILGGKTWNNLPCQIFVPLTNRNDAKYFGNLSECRPCVVGFTATMPERKIVFRLLLLLYDTESFIIECATVPLELCGTQRTRI